MKLKITITGLKVHDVGYRPYLTELAMRLALRGFEVYNDEEDGRQAVIALVEADEQNIKRFYNSAMKDRPQLAKVDNIKSEDYSGEIMPLWQFASISTASQMNKAIPVLLKIQDNTNLLPRIAENTDLLPRIAKNTDHLPDIAENTGLLPKIVANTNLLPEIAENTKPIHQVIEEIKGFREEIQPGLAVQIENCGRTSRL